MPFQNLQAEAGQLARAQVGALAIAIAQAERLAGEIADGGEAYPPGIRDLARSFAEQAQGKVQALVSITVRA